MRKRINFQRNTFHKNRKLRFKVGTRIIHKYTFLKKNICVFGTIISQIENYGYFVQFDAFELTSRMYEKELLRKHY